MMRQPFSHYALVTCLFTEAQDLDQISNRGMVEDVYGLHVLAQRLT
ncbi:hypothetical protein DAVIS_04194 [Mycobacterium marinum]|uniref:Uncharacterized protein n=1 Tax=Mycobacterium marinum TaxID=1781 RepID=A0A3E2MRL9_MYCMR|nr:hypothetical protein DAVIS_04194 [Mycobacterium marinum]